MAMPLIVNGIDGEKSTYLQEELALVNSHFSLSHDAYPCVCHAIRDAVHCLASRWRSLLARTRR